MNPCTVFEFSILTLFLFPASITGRRRGPADKQLETWKKSHKEQLPAIGINYELVPSLTGTLGIGAKGPLLLQDINFQVHLANAANTRIPERVVHAKAAGAKGYFIATRDMSKYTQACIFSKVGQRTPVVVRMSTVVGSLGSADTVLDMRGFAVKFKTPEGNYDLMMTNVPVFPVRDAILFSQMTRSRGRNAQTHLPDPNMFFDYTAHRPESTFNVFLVHTNLSFFKNYRHMKGHAISPFLWNGGTQTTKEPIYVRYQMLPNLKPKTSSPKTFEKWAGIDPDYMIRDLYNAIARKRYPTYTLYIQMFTNKDWKAAIFNFFDPTKMLFESDFPLIPIGKLILDENPKDYFNEVEQAAFSPANMIPGIHFSRDRLLQGRPFAYLQAQTHRLGSNFFQLPINHPLPEVKGQMYLRNGFMNIDGNGDGAPHYYPNSFNGAYVDPKAKIPSIPVEGGIADAHDIKDGNDYFQIDRYWREKMTPFERKRTIKILGQHLALASKRIIERSLKVNWDPINQEISTMLRQELGMPISSRGLNKDEFCSDSERSENELNTNCNNTKETYGKINYY